MAGAQHYIYNSKHLHAFGLQLQRGFCQCDTRRVPNKVAVCESAIAYKDMIAQLELGKASAVFVKDLSRLGRNYIEVGRLTEEFFPEHDIRLVSVSDAIDTDEGENELAPIRNLFNEWYSRDISKKRRISNKIRGNAGIPMGFPPYGYMKAPDGSKRWVVDDEAAAVVRRIFRLYMDGLGAEQIAARLSEERVLTPTNYWRERGVKRPNRPNTNEPFRWNSSTVITILSRQEYCGDLINFKTYSKSYKNKKRLDNAPENWVIFKDIHEAIVPRELWKRVQQKRAGIRKRQTNKGEHNMFSGLLVCADCGRNLHYHFNSRNPEITFFSCPNTTSERGTCTGTHYIRVDFLEQVVLGEIRRLTKFVSQYETQFAKLMMGFTQQAMAAERKQVQLELSKAKARDSELDTLFEKLYEDNVSGKISDERFVRMSKKPAICDNEMLFLFKLTDFELFVNGKKSKSYLPGEWRDYFGTPVEQHEESYKINLADGYITTDKT